MTVLEVYANKATLEIWERDEIKTAGEPDSAWWQWLGTASPAELAVIGRNKMDSYKPGSSPWKIGRNLKTWLASGNRSL